MARLLELLLIAALVIWVLYSPALRQKKGSRGQPGAKPGQPQAQPPGAPTDTMVACSRCGVHLPASEAVQDARGRPFCCPEHRDAP